MIDNSDILQLLRRVVSAGANPELDEQLRVAFSDLSAEVGIELITSLDVASFCAVGLHLSAILSGDRTDMLLRAFDKVANLARLEGRHQEARLAFEAKLILNPADFNVRFAIAEYLERAGTLTEAYEVMKPGIAAINHLPAWQLFVRVALAAGDVDAATPYIEKLVSLDPTEPELRRLKKEAAVFLASRQLGVPGLDEASIVKAVNDISELGWPLTLGDALKGVAGRPEAGAAARAMERLYLWSTSAATSDDDQHCEEDARLLAAAGGLSFLVQALSRAPAATDGRPRGWVASAYRNVLAARDLDSLLLGLTASKTERAVVWHLRKLTALLKERSSFLETLTLERMNALARAYTSCLNFHPIVKVEAQQLLWAAAASREDLVAVLVTSLRQLHLEEEARQVMRLALAREDVDVRLIKPQSDTLHAEGKESEAKSILLWSALGTSEINRPIPPEAESGHGLDFRNLDALDLEKAADRLAAEGRLGDAMKALTFSLDALNQAPSPDRDVHCDMLLKHGDLALRMGAAAIALTSYKQAYTLRPARLAVDRMRRGLWDVGKTAASVSMLSSDAPELVAVEHEVTDDRVVQEGNRILYFITWHEDPSSLVRLLTALHDDLNYYFISIGGRSTSQEIDQLLWLAQAPNVFLFKGSPAAWGARKLLYENAFIGIDFLLAVLPQCRWIQILCNQCFPLTSQPEARRRLAGNSWPSTMHTPPPPGVYESFYAAGKPAFADVHNVLHSVLRRADSKDLAFQDFMHFGINACTFNFSGQPLAMNVNFKAKGMNYWVKPHSVDMRTMGPGRFVEITDVSDEGSTYSQLLALRHAQAVHSILRRYQLYTGDPFVMISRDHAEYLMTDPVAHELYLAMAHEFGPEMNYFDTVRMNSPFRDEPAHSFFRGQRDDQMVTADDIDQAIDSNKLFIRKVTREFGQDFARYFGERIAMERPEQARCWSVTLETTEPGYPDSRSLRNLVDWPTTEAWLLRDLHGKPLAYIVAHEDGRVLREDGSDFGTWTWGEDGSLLLDGATGTPALTFRRVTSIDGKFILVPDTLVWVGTDWGRFLEQPIIAAWKHCFSAEPVQLALDTARLRLPQVVIREGKSEFGVAIAGYSNIPDDPMISTVRELAGECSHIGQAKDGTILARFEVDERVLILRLQRALLTLGRQVLVFTRATSSQHELSFQLDEGAEIVFDTGALLSQTWWVRSRRFPMWRELGFNPNGQVSLEGCSRNGFARLQGGRLTLVDVGDWAVCVLPQISWTDRGWHLSGYGQYDLAEDDYLHVVTSVTGKRPE